MTRLISLPAPKMSTIIRHRVSPNLPLGAVMYCSRIVVTAMEFCRNPWPLGRAPPHIGRPCDPPSDLSLGQAWQQKPFPEVSSQGPATIHGEGACPIAALSRCGHDGRRPDPGPCHQAAGDWAKNPQTLDYLFISHIFVVSNVHWPAIPQHHTI